MIRPDAPAARERILLAALGLLDSGGVEAVSTRAVAAHARVQAPAIYRLFGDKDGLLDSAAERAYADWVARKSTTALPDDPVEAIRAGWDDAVRFGLDHPAAYRISQSRSDRGPSTMLGYAILNEKVLRIARAGRLAVSTDHACALLHATGRGVILTLIDTAPEARDMQLSVLARESTIAGITTDPPQRSVSVASTATTLRTMLPDIEELHPAERHMMDLWLDRITAAGVGGGTA